MVALRRYYFRGPKRGQVEVFADNLPGTPDNIRRMHSTGHYLIGVGAKRTQPFALLNFLSPYPRLRDLVACLLPRRWASWVPPRRRPPPHPTYHPHPLFCRRRDRPCSASRPGTGW